MTIDGLDRLFFEVIRRALVYAQVLPDQTTFTTQAAFDAARKSTNPLVDVFGVGTEDSRGGITTNRIVVDRIKKETGSIGVSPSSYFGPLINGTFTKYLEPDASKNVEYEITIMSYSTAMDRVLSSIIDFEFGERRNMQSVDVTGAFEDDYATIICNGDVFVSSRKDIIERMYRFTASDVFLTQERVVYNNIVPLTSVQYSLYLKPQPGIGDVPDLIVNEPQNGN